MTSLAKSALWLKMQEYYHNIGPEAWQDEVVPLQISSNKKLANAYAQIIMAQINDWLAHNLSANTFAGESEPFYIVEIGAGHGRFSFYLLKCLEPMLALYNLPLTAIKLIITDIAEKNVQSCEQHPALKDFVAKGVVDFAVFNAMTDASLKLRRSGQAISQGSLHKPLFAVANYLFDSLAHDAFLVRDHQLHEVQIHIDSEANWTEYFAKAKFSFDYIPIGNGADYYADQRLNQILAHYADTLDNCTFMIPVGGIDCINMMQKFSHAPLVLLIADKGHAHPDLFDEVTEPDISEHGSISLMVNFDALGQYFNACGGQALLMPNDAIDFQVACLSSKTYPNPHSQLAFRNALGGATSQDIINLCYDDEEITDIYKSLDQLLAILNLSLWDPNVLYDFHEMILDRIEAEDPNAEQEHALLNGLKVAWDYFFKVEKTADLPFAIGSCYYALDFYEEAINFYKISLQEFGPNADNLYNMAITYQALDDDANAKIYVKQTLDLDPEYEDASALLIELG